MSVPGPTQNQVRAVDPVLTAWMSTRGNEDSDFIADLVFPPTYKEGDVSGTYFTQTTDVRSAGNIELNRGVGAPYPRVGFGLGTATFNTIEYGVEVAIDRKLRGQSQAPIDLQQLAAIRAQREVEIQRELRVVAAMFGTGDWTNESTLGAGAQWDDAGGDPLADIWTAKRSVKLNSGKNANTMVLGWDAFRVLVQNGDVTGLMPSATRQSQITFTELQMRLAEAFEIDRVFVGRSVRNTANQGQTEAYGFIWTDNMWIGHIPSSGPEGPSFAQFASTDGGAPTVVDRYFEDNTRSEVVRVREERDEAVVDAVAGHLTIDCAN